MAYIKLTDSNESLCGSMDRMTSSGDLFERVSIPDSTTQQERQAPPAVTDDPILRSPPERVTITRKRHLKKTLAKKLTGAEGILTVIALIIFFANAAARGYLNGVLILIQHTMNIKESEVILTDIMFDIGIVIGLIPGVMVRNHMDRPKTLAISTTALAVGCFMCAGPYFWFARNHHLYSEPVDIEEYDMCGEVPELWTPDPKPPPENTHSSEFFVIFGAGLMGIGTSLMFVVGLPYTVDAFAGKRTPLVTGILLIAGAAGIWTGELFSFLIQLTASGMNYSYNNVSRWWLGFLLFGLFSLLLSLLLCTFQDECPPSKEDENPQDAESSPDAPDDTDGFYYMRLDDERQRNKKCIPFLTKHINIVFLSVALSLEGAIFTGYLVFQPQFISVVTGQSLPRAELSFASITLLPFILGILISAFYIQFVKMDSRQLCRAILIFNIIGLGLSGMLFLFKCKEPEVIPALNVLPTAAPRDCMTSCVCNDLYTPVCGSNHVTYLSPCQAGCVEENNTANHLVFQNCECIPEGAAVTGPCPADCASYGWHMLLIFVIFILTGIQFCAAVYIIFKASTGYQRVCALAFFEIMYRILGNLPALGYFRFTLSRACLLWASSTGKDPFKYNYDQCILFNVNSHHFFFTSLIMLLKAIILVCYTVAFVFTKKEQNEITVAERETIHFRRLDLEDDDSFEEEPPGTPV